MRNPEIYPWQAVFALAILETDDAQACSRIYEAIAAVEQRRLSPIDSKEDLALTDAEAGLQILITERIAKTE
jgi:hypothetical protein